MFVIFLANSYHLANALVAESENVLMMCWQLYPNQKAWINGEVRAYNTASASLKAYINEAKRKH